MDKQQAAREAFEKERRIKVAGFNGCKKAKEGFYCQPCVAQATNYTYSGEQDRRKSQHIYKRHLPDVNFEYWYNKNCTVDLDLTSAKIGWQASRSALMPALVEARDALGRASKCQFQRYYQRNDGSSYLAGDDDAEYAVRLAIASIDNILGSYK